MPYLIDGHNLIGQMPTISLTDPHDEAKLVERLRRFMARQGKRCTVVFDGGLPGGLSRDLSTPSVQVVFAHGGTNADRIILERIRHARDATRLIVVSADREIVDAAQRRRMRVIPPAEFAADLDGPTVPDEPDAGENANPRLTPGEVDDWLRLFQRKQDPDS
ncbi:MAG: NYN domain-containing protein [Anaerolineae bacterium]|nr:NYN domain-containing protein [Anaerolineae bacterium]